MASVVDIVVRIINEGRGIKDAEGDLMKLGKALAKTAIAVTAFGFALKKGFDFAAQGAQIARLETAGASLARSYGADMNTILSALKKASRGTVAETDLILSANRAMMLGVSADADKMANLLEVAAFRGRAMGLSTSQAFNDIVTGIGRMSPLILDNLGIVIDADKRTRDWAAANGIAADQVDAATKRQILFNGVLEEGNRQLEQVGGLTDDVATAYERLGAQGTDAFNRLKKSAGAFFEPMVGWLADSLEGTNQLNDAFDILGLLGANTNTIWREIQSGAGRSKEEIIALANSFGLFLKLKDVSSSDVWDEIAGGIGKIEDAAIDAVPDIDDFYSSLKADPLKEFMDIDAAIKFFKAGGQEIAKWAEDLRVDVFNALTTGGEVPSKELKNAQQAAIALQVALGNLDAQDAIDQMKELGFPVEEAKQDLNDFISLYTGLDGQSVSAFLRLNVDSNVPFGVLQQALGLSRGRTAEALRLQAQADRYQQKASGGWLGKITEVGEEGAEGIVEIAPGKFWVVPADEWRARKRQGMRAGRGMAVGGGFGDPSDFGGSGSQAERTFARLGVGGTQGILKDQSSVTSGQETTQVTQVQAVAESAAASAAAGGGGAVAAQSQQESSRAISTFTQASIRSNDDLIKEVRVLVEEVRKLAKADD